MAITFGKGGLISVTPSRLTPKGSSEPRYSLEGKSLAPSYPIGLYEVNVGGGKQTITQPTTTEPQAPIIIPTSSSNTTVPRHSLFTYPVALVEKATTKLGINDIIPSQVTTPRREIPQKRTIGGGEVYAEPMNISLVPSYSTIHNIAATAFFAPAIDVGAAKKATKQKAVVKETTKKASTEEIKNLQSSLQENVVTEQKGNLLIVREKTFSDKVAEVSTLKKGFTGNQKQFNKIITRIYGKEEAKRLIQATTEKVYSTPTPQGIEVIGTKPQSLSPSYSPSLSISKKVSEPKKPQLLTTELRVVTQEKPVSRQSLSVKPLVKTTTKQKPVSRLGSVSLGSLASASRTKSLQAPKVKTISLQTPKTTQQTRQVPRLSNKPLFSVPKTSGRYAPKEEFFGGFGIPKPERSRGVIKYSRHSRSSRERNPLYQASVGSVITGRSEFISEKKYKRLSKKRFLGLGLRPYAK